MFAEFHRRALALRHYLRFERTHFRIALVESLAARRLFDAPVDHVARRRRAPQLYLKPPISFRAPVGRVRASHRACAATDRSVGREPFIEVELLAERDLFSGHGIVFRDQRFPDVGGQSDNRLCRPPESSSSRSDMCFITLLSVVGLAAILLVE